MVTTVRQLLASKGHRVWSVPPNATVYEALSLMAEKNIGAVLVMDEEGICGIFSERDFARRVGLAGKQPTQTPVKEVMTRRILVVHPEQTIHQCMALMTEKRLRHLPVVEGEDLVGLVSIGDVVKAVISDQEFMLGQLETYIMGHAVPG
ncbi:MAG: CBS domain-containing protein [Caldilineae bacterium]|nr:MAG: CBS domain-containing protein [Caldilineae bacterium]